MLDWPENDFRIFVGDLGNEANDDVLAKAFNKFATFQKARIVRDKKSNKTKGAALEAMMLLKGCIALRNTAFQRPQGVCMGLSPACLYADSERNVVLYHLFLAPFMLLCHSLRLNSVRTLGVSLCPTLSMHRPVSPHTEDNRNFMAPSADLQT